MIRVFIQKYYHHECVQDYTWIIPSFSIPKWSAPGSCISIFALLVKMANIQKIQTFLTFQLLWRCIIQVKKDEQALNLLRILCHDEWFIVCILWKHLQNENKCVSFIDLIHVQTFLCVYVFDSKLWFFPVFIIFSLRFICSMLSPSSQSHTTNII